MKKYTKKHAAELLAPLLADARQCSCEAHKSLNDRLSDGVEKTAPAVLAAVLNDLRFSFESEQDAASTVCYVVRKELHAEADGLYEDGQRPPSIKKYVEKVEWEAAVLLAFEIISATTKLCANGINSNIHMTADKRITAEDVEVFIGDTLCALREKAGCASEIRRLFPKITEASLWDAVQIKKQNEAQALADYHARFAEQVAAVRAAKAAAVESTHAV